MKEKVESWLERNRIFWALIFGTLFFLSIDFWNWSSDDLMFGFLPYWVFRLVLLQFSLFLFFWLFVKKYWSDQRC
ncbi:MAG: hypothetical protein ACOCTN_07555 [Candidatus Natronoplasma sp.]